MGRAKSGRLAAVYESFSTPVQGAWTKMTWTAASKKATVGSNFWVHSYDHAVEIRMNGVRSGGAITTNTQTDSVTVSAFTGYLAGASVSVSAATISGLAQATGAGDRIVYAIIYTSSGLSAVAGTSGSAVTTRGTAGGPPYISTAGFVVGYVTRLDTGAEVVTAGEITQTAFDGAEWSHSPSVDEIRGILGRVDFVTLPAAVHTGDTYPGIYWRGYSFNDNFVKIGEMKNWSLGIAPADEDATTQNSFATESDVGRVAYTMSYEEFIADPIHESFKHVNNSKGDRIYKLYSSRTDTANYLACQGREQVDMTFPMDDKSSSSNTVTITGRVEEFTS